jgi:O-antigen chain-terminating methyltransferase
VPGADAVPHAPAAPAPAPGDPAAQRALELAYLRFQREHRGDEVQLRRAQVRYVDVIREALAEGGLNGHAPRLLDVACGDGIFLQLAREAGWETQGVDLNATLVKLGRERGLAIEHEDAIAYLERCGPARFDAMTALQFIEHLEPEALMRLLRAARKALRPGGVLIIETLNPNTLKALHWYFLDLTHARLVFPEMLRLLGETAGFRFERWEGINPAPAEQRLAPAPAADDATRANFDRLNELVYGPQDYYLVLRRPVTASDAPTEAESASGAAAVR